LTTHLSIVLMLLLAALLHASWNAVTKGSREPLLAIWMVISTCGVIGGAALPWTPIPTAEVWIYLGASMSVHLAYQLFLAHAYEKGDLSQVYPIARGISPLLVALLAALFAAEPLGPRGAAGVVIVTVAIASLAFGPGSLASGRGLGSALMVGLMISGYTFVDAQGIRASERPIDYIAWSFPLQIFPITAIVLLRKRRDILPYLRRHGAWGFGGGVMATIAYGLVLWAIAMTPMAAVSALRETSVVFAAFIGSRVLGEPFGARRVAASAFVALGIVLIVV
jgi:drug/metabolite transporter (DMT)-like permease